MRRIDVKDYADVSLKAPSIIAAQIQLHPDFTLASEEEALSLVKEYL